MSDGSVNEDAVGISRRFHNLIERLDNAPKNVTKWLERDDAGTAAPTASLPPALLLRCRSGARLPTDFGIPARPFSYGSRRRLHALDATR